MAKEIWNPKGQEALRKARLLARKVLEAIDKVDFKPETSAKWTNITRHWNGALRVQIQHQDMAGVSPKMLKWWFENLGQKTTWNGTDFSGEEVSFTICGIIGIT